MPDFVLAVNIGGTNIRVARVSSAGRISHCFEAATPPVGGIAVIDTVVKLLERVPQKNVRALGVDDPGRAHSNGDAWAPNIPGWKRIPLGKELRERLQLPVVVESDRNAFVVGETWKGASHGCSDVVFLAVGTGIGAGILAGGHLLRGYARLAGCMGWMAVRDQFLPQYSKFGCLERHASGLGIGIAASRRLKRKVTAQDAFQLAVKGDKRAQEVLREAGCYLGLALANLVSTLNPEIIVLGGGVAEAGE